jgi:hypothetical protein
MIYVANREALASFVDAWTQAATLAEVLVTDGMRERGGHPRPGCGDPADTRAPSARDQAPADRLDPPDWRTILADDATLLVLVWYSGHGHGRATVAGSDPVRPAPSSP